MPGTGCGLGLVVFPCNSISHVFERFNVILLLAAQCFMLLTSVIVGSVLSLLTGMLMVMSSANFTIIRFLLGSANCMSLTIKKNKMGPRTVPQGTPQLISMNSVVTPSNKTQEIKDPVDHIGIYIGCLKLLREDVMRNSIECFAEVE